MLLNEFLKAHRKVEQLETAAAQQAKEVQDLHAAFKTQAAQIEKISAQLETSRPGSGGGRQQVALSSDSAEASASRGLDDVSDSSVNRNRRAIMRTR